MNVLSLFDGISCARVALGNKVNKYYASEIDKNAISVAQRNFPDTIQLGDVKNIKSIPVPIDLLIGGSPCTDLSIGKKERKGLEGNHSKLFWEYVRLKNLLNPKWFILENVASMPTKDRDIISKTLAVEPILLDASLVSAQCRKRLFWTNIPNIPALVDREITIADILETEYDPKKDCIARIVNRRLKDGKRHDGDHSIPQTRVIELRKDRKTGTLTSVQKDNVVVRKEGESTSFRPLSPIECERLQGLPDNYTAGVCKTARYKAIGNAFHTEIIKHIINQIPQ
jgi:DNA (cytosine-5)-methyltransferase 3A